MVAQTTTRKKGTDVYRYGVYRCGFAKTKGPAVCTHGTGYRQERLEAAVVAKFREAMTAPTIDALARMVNTQLEVVFQGHGARTAELTGEMARLEGQSSRKLPRQVDTSKADFRGASGLGRNVRGGTWPRRS